MNMTEKVLNKNKAKLLLMIMTRKIFHMTMLIMKKMTMKYFHMTMMIMKKMTKVDRFENYMFCMSWLKQQQHQQQLQYMCQKFCTKKDTNILLQKRIKERDASANSSKYIPPKYICKLVSNSYKKTKWGESWLYISKL